MNELNRRLKVALVSVHDARSIRTFSGITFHVLEKLREFGVEVEVVSPLQRRFRFLLAPSAIWARLRGRGSSLDHFRYALRSYAKQIGEHLHERQVDVVFSTSSIPITLLDRSFATVFWTGSVYHQMHDYYQGNFGNPSPSALKRGEWQEETALERADFAIYASRWAADAAAQLTDPSKIRVLPWGASVQVSHSRSDIRNWALEKRSKRPHACELLFIGIDWERKGGNFAIEVSKLLNERGIQTTLRVVGCHPQRDLPRFVELEGFVNKSSAEGRSRFETLCRSADFFILPTKAEAAGIVFCEACAYGLPSATFRTGGISDYVRDGVTGFCFEPASTPEIFAQHIGDVILDQEAYVRLAEQSFDEYYSRLNWSTSVRGLIEILHTARFEFERRNSASS